MKKLEQERIEFLESVIFKDIVLYSIEDCIEVIDICNKLDTEGIECSASGHANMCGTKWIDKEGDDLLTIEEITLELCGGASLIKFLKDNSYMKERYSKLSKTGFCHDIVIDTYETCRIPSRLNYELEDDRVAFSDNFFEMDSSVEINTYYAR